jgi:hypothetical protein
LHYVLIERTPVIIVVSAVLGAAVFVLAASSDTIFDDGAGANGGGITESENVYNVPVSNNVKNSTTLFYGKSPHGPMYLEERVSASDYTRREDNRSLEK